MGKPVGRFAPSPSGEMHLGNAWSALIAWLSAHSLGGHMVLRLEDLDRQRCTPAFSQQVMADLTWLGLTWVGEPMYQSRRDPAYSQALEKLQEKNLIYPCYCTRGERMAASAPHAGDHLIYPGTCRLSPPTDPAILARTPSLRVAVPGEVVALECTLDVQGEVRQNLAESCGDFVVQRGDGNFAYHLAVVVDDFAQGVTQVVRGQDLRPVTPQQIWLGRELGCAPLEYGHVPLLLAEDGRRLAKRDGDLTMATLKNQLSPEILVGKLAHLAGWTERLTPLRPVDLLPVFTWERVPSRDLVVERDFFRNFPNS